MNFLLWYVPSALLALLLFLMIRNRVHRVCPWFFAYVVFGVGAGVARFAVRNYQHAYYTTYWTSEAIYCVLGILAMYEVFRAVLRTLTHSGWFQLIFPSVVIVGVVLSLARAHAVPPRVNGLLVYIVTGEIAVRFVQVLSVILTLIPLLGLRGQRYPLGVAAGFGLYSTAALLITAKVSDFGTRYAFLWSVVSVATYSMALLIWIWAFRLPQGEPPTSGRGSRVALEPESTELSREPATADALISRVASAHGPLVRGSRRVR